MDTRLKKCSEIAKVIAGTNAPDSLVRGLCRENLRLHNFIQSDEQAPLRADQIKKLNVIEKAAADLLTVFDDPITYSFLDHSVETRWTLQDAEDIKRALKDIAYRAFKAGDLIQKKGGQKRAFPNVKSDTLDARLLCALIVTVAWRLFHPNGPNDKDAGLIVCRDFWKAAGGLPLSAAGGLPGWARWLARAREILKRQEADSLRQEAARIRFSLQAIPTQSPLLGAYSVGSAGAVI